MSYLLATDIKIYLIYDLLIVVLVNYFIYDVYFGVSIVLIKTI